MFVLRPWNYQVDVDFEVVGALAITVIMGCVTAYLLYRYAIKTIGPAKASLFSSSELVSATILSVLWLGTPITLIDLIGFAMILAVVFILTMDKQEEAADEAK